MIDYVQIADVPGRGEPGSGKLDWADRLAVLRASGYDGPIGLEFYPTVESVASITRSRVFSVHARTRGRHRRPGAGTGAFGWGFCPQMRPTVLIERLGLVE